MGSDAKDGPIPAVLVHICNTFQYWESFLVKRGFARWWGAGVAGIGWWVALFSTASWAAQRTCPNFARHLEMYVDSRCCLRFS